MPIFLQTDRKKEQRNFNFFLLLLYLAVSYQLHSALNRAVIRVSTYDSEGGEEQIEQTLSSLETRFLPALSSSLSVSFHLSSIPPMPPPFDAFTTASAEQPHSVSSGLYNNPAYIPATTHSHSSPNNPAYLGTDDNGGHNTAWKVALTLDRDGRGDTMTEHDSPLFVRRGAGNRGGRRAWFGMVGLAIVLSIVAVALAASAATQGSAAEDVSHLMGRLQMLETNQSGD